MSVAKRRIFEEMEANELEDNLDDLKELFSNGMLSDWESGFAESVIDQWEQRSRLSEKQVDKISEIVERHEHDLEAR